jgi:hypothetical protein
VRVGAALLSQEHVPVDRTAPAGLEPAPLPLTAGGTTVVLRGKTSQDGRIRTCVLMVPNHATTTPGPRPESVPAAGIEPAAFSFSGRRSYRLSYAGIERPWWESNPRKTILQTAA